MVRTNSVSQKDFSSPEGAARHSPVPVAAVLIGSDAEEHEGSHVVRLYLAIRRTIWPAMSAKSTNRWLRIRTYGPSGRYFGDRSPNGIQSTIASQSTTDIAFVARYTPDGHRRRDTSSSGYQSRLQNNYRQSHIPMPKLLLAGSNLPVSPFAI